MLLRAAELLAGPWRDTLNAATMLGQSKTAHQAEIDAACESIDFFRFNVEFMTRIYAEQPHLVAGRLEPAWSTGRSRASCFAVSPVQLHGDRGEPDELAGADGERRRLEAGRHGDALGLLPDAPVPGGRAARRRDQPRLRLGRRRSATRRSQPAPRRHPLHRLDRRSSTGCGARSRRTWSATATTRASSARPAARTSSSRIRPPTSTRSRRRSCAARSSTRGRSARRRRASTRRRTSGRSCASACRSEVATIKMGDVSDFGNFMGAVIDGSSFRTQAEAIEEAKAHAETDDRRRRRLRRLAAGTSSSRR